MTDGVFIVHGLSSIVLINAMAASRIDIFRMMLEGDPDNTAVMFGLAKEYEKAARFDDMVQVLSDYLQRADDEGNAYGMLATAYLKLGNRAAARRAYEKGAEVAQAHGHPSMAQDYRFSIETEFED
jgi:predicted Zn-dependent protease